MLLRITLLIAFITQAIAGGAIKPIGLPIDSNVSQFGCTASGDAFALRIESRGTRFFILSSEGQKDWLVEGVTLPYLAFHAPIAWGFEKQGERTALIQYDLKKRRLQRTQYVMWDQTPTSGGMRFIAKKIEQGKPLEPKPYVISHADGEVRELALNASIAPGEDRRLPHLIANTWKNNPEGSSIPITDISLAFGLERIETTTQEFLRAFSIPGELRGTDSQEWPDIATMASCGPSSDEFLLGLNFYTPGKRALYRASLAELLQDDAMEALPNENLLAILVAGETRAAWLAGSALQKRNLPEAQWSELLSKLDAAPDLKEPLEKTIAKLGDDSFRVREAAYRDIINLAKTTKIWWIQNTLLKALDANRKNADLEIALRSRRALEEIAEFYALGVSTVADPAIKARLAFVRHSPIRSAWAETAVHDFTQINEQLASLVNQSLDSDELVKVSRGEFDAGFSSISKKRLRHQRMVELLSPPWKKGETTQVDIQNSYWVDTQAPLPTINLAQSLAIKTDLLAMFRYTAQLLLRKKHLKNLEPQDTVNQTIERYTTVDSLSALHERLNADRATALSVIDHRLKELTNPLPENSGDTSGLSERYRKESIEEQQLLRSEVNALKFEGVFEGNTLKAIRCDRLEGSRLLPALRHQATLERSELLLHEEGLNIQIGGNYRPEARSYRKLIDDLEILAAQIENKEAQKSDEIVKEFQIGLKKFRQAIKGEDVK